MSSKKKIYLFSLILGIFNLALIILLISPLISAIGKTSQDLISQKKELILLSQKKENLENLEKTYQGHQEDLEKIETFFVDSETPFNFFRFLEDTAQDSQVSIKKELPPKGETDFGPALSFNISLEGSFPNFLKFLEKLENSPYLIEILNLNIKRLEAGLISATFPIRVLTK